jgi:peptidylprolyl isomerase
MSRFPTTTLALLLAALSTASALAQAPKKPAPTLKAPEMITTPSGLKYLESHPGKGASPATGQKCVMHYTGWLSDNGQKGKKFDSSVDAGQPFTFVLGVGRVIKGWDEGIASMKKGGKRTLHIPPELAYGARGAGNGVIPPNATLIFDVELLDIQ